MQITYIYASGEKKVMEILSNLGVFLNIFTNVRLNFREGKSIFVLLFFTEKFVITAFRGRTTN